MKDSNQKKSEIGVKSVLDYLRKQGKNPIDFSTNREHKGEHKGYDILVGKQKIEVKCSARHKGIPDCFVSEFDKNKNLIADFMYIVRLNKLKPYAIQILSKKEFNKYSALHKKKIIIKIASALKTDLEKNKVGRTIKI